MNSYFTFVLEFNRKVSFGTDFSTENRIELVLFKMFKSDDPSAADDSQTSFTFHMIFVIIVNSIEGMESEHTLAEGLPDTCRPSFVFLSICKVLYFLSSSLD